MLNKVILMGRLTKDPEYKMTPQGTAVASFTLAIERNCSSDGERQTDFINCVAFRGTADFLHKHFGKGQLVCICGMIQSRTWEDSENKKHYVTEVIANEVNFTGDRRKETENTSAEAQPSEEFIRVPDDQLPF